jgi:hypothetical protein
LTRRGLASKYTKQFPFLLAVSVVGFVLSFDVGMHNGYVSGLIVDDQLNRE